MLIFLLIIICVAYILLYMSSTLPDIVAGQVIKPAENPKCDFFWLFRFKK